eukprot:PhF_6_TR17057/c1_g1_i2/m.26037
MCWRVCRHHRPHKESKQTLTICTPFLEAYLETTTRSMTQQQCRMMTTIGNIATAYASSSPNHSLKNKNNRQTVGVVSTITNNIALVDKLGGVSMKAATSGERVVTNTGSIA